MKKTIRRRAAEGSDGHDADDKQQQTHPAAKAAAVWDKITLGGSLVFCSAVLTQLLQLSALTTSLWVAVFACSVAMPFLIAGLILMVGRQEFSLGHDSNIFDAITIIGQLGTFGCVVAVFWHFSWVAGSALLFCTIAAIFLLLADIGMIAVEREEKSKERDSGDVEEG